jgi:hypothetical protein
MTNPARHMLAVRSQRPHHTAVEVLENRRLLSSTSAPSFLVPTAPGVDITPILTVGDSADNDYRMVGIPDGLGAFDNGDGTFTVLMNHELGPDRGITRDHGSAGAFVSKWIIEKDTLHVLEGDDLIKHLKLWNEAEQKYEDLARALDRLCSADLPEPTAFYNPITGLGTTERIFTNGEETRPPFSDRHGSAFGHVVTGLNAGTSWELPRLGKMSYENVVASPYAQDKTVVAALDDSDRKFSTEGATEPSEVYFYVGTKQSTGSEVDKAGLTNGLLYGLKVAGALTEDALAAGPNAFDLHGFGDVSGDADGSKLQTDSIAAGVTQFRRVEDGHWDPTDSNAFYFTTTDQFGGNTRVWKVTFNDITNPQAGGKIELAIDSHAAAPGEMFDNLTVNKNGDVLLQEDPGGNPYLAKVWQWDASSGDLIQVAEHNPDLFLDTDPATVGVQSKLDIDPFTDGIQGTIDEESSGIIDVSDILGPGRYLVDVQAHYRLSDPELVEAGQFLLIDTNVPKASLKDGLLKVEGTINDDHIHISRHGQDVTVTVNWEIIGTFSKKEIEAIAVFGHAGDDTVSIGRNVKANAIIIGGQGSDDLGGGSGSDILIGDDVNLTDAALSWVLSKWSGKGTFCDRKHAVEKAILDKIIEDDDVDYLCGAGGKDLLFDVGGEDWA